MAQIPQLERLSPVKTLPQNDRINMQVKDQGSQILNQTNTIADLGDKGAQMYQMYENDKIEQISNAAEMEYTKWNNDQLTKLKQIEGDPTAAYAEYDKAVTQKKADMIAARPDYGENVMTHVSGRLDKVIGHQSIASDHQRGQQQEIYANNLFESTVKTKRDGLAVNAGYIQKGDPTSFSVFDQNVADIKATIAKNGIKKGTVTVLPDDADSKDYYIDDTGKMVKVDMSPIAKSRFAKDLAEGVKGSLDVLISTGRIEEARELQTRYGGVLTPAQTMKIEAKYKSVGRKQEAYNVLDSIKGLDEGSQVERIEAIKDPELRSEALKIKDADDRRITNMRTRKEKVNYDTLGGHILEKMSSGQPYNGIADLEADPVYQQTIDNLSVKQKKAVHEMVDSPKDSDMKAVLKVQNLFLHDEDGQDIATMSDQDFAESLTGLSKSDRTYYSRKFFTERSQTDGERRAMNKSAGKILRDQLISSEIIVPRRDGKLGTDDQQTLMNAQTNLIDYLSKTPNLKDDAKIAEFVKQNSADIIKGKLKNPNITKTIPKSDTSRQPGNDDTINITQRQLVDFQRSYKNATKGTAFPKPSDPAFEAYVRKQMKK